MTGTFGSVAVIDGPQPVVLVPMGVQGILRFDGQRWERLGVLGLQPLTTWGPPWLQQASILVLLGVMLAAVPMALISQVHQRRRRRWIGAAITSAVAGLVGLVLAATAAFVASGDSTLFTTIVAVLSLCPVVAALAWVWLPVRPPPPPLPYPRWPGMP